MALTAARKRFRTSQCREYRECFDGFCEENQFMHGCNRYANEVHHILGRCNDERSDWFCNLIFLNDRVHHDGHDKHPAQLEVSCLWVKMERRKRELSMLHLFPWVDNDDAHRKHWNIDAMDAICGSPTLAGRIEGILLPKVTGTVYERYAVELLRFIESE